jgi:hypothetical protein
MIAKMRDFFAKLVRFSARGATADSFGKKATFFTSIVIYYFLYVIHIFKSGYALVGRLADQNSKNYNNLDPNFVII